MYVEKDNKKLVNTKDLESIIELVLLSGWIENADPLSLIISSKVGAGKTELIKQYSNVKGVKFLSEATAFGIKTEFLQDIESKTIRHLMIGDLLVPLSKQKKTRDDFIAFFNTIIEEGIQSIHSYALNVELRTPVKCGLITTIAKPDLLSKSRRWAAMGFLSRALPLTYGYSRSTELKIYRHIATSQGLSEMPKKTMWLPTKPVTVKQDLELNLRLIEMSMDVARLEKVYGFRRQEQLQTLLMATALKNRRHQVEKEDYDEIVRLSEYINLDFKEV